MSERMRHWAAVAITTALHLLPLLLLLWAAVPAAPVPVAEDTRISLRMIAPATAPPQPLEETQAPQPTQAARASTPVRPRTPPPPPPGRAPEGMLQASAQGLAGAVVATTNAVPHTAPERTPALASITAAPPAPDAPPASHLAGADSDQWEARLMAQLERHRYYPAAARARRQQGIVWVRAIITRDGRLQALRLERSSGLPLLDDAALKTFRRAQPLPPIPEEMSAPQELAVPVDYFLRQAGLANPRA